MPVFLVVLEWLGEVVGLNLARWFGWQAFKELCIKAAQRLGAQATIAAIAWLFQHLWELSEWKEQMAAKVLEMSGVKISPSDLTNKDAWRVAIGKRGAELVNEQLGTTFTTIYPPDNLMGEVGKFLAQKINTQYGTEFDSVWPPDGFIVDVKDEIVAELTSGKARLLSEADLTSLKNAIRVELDEKMASGVAISIGTQDDVKLAKKRAKARARQKKFRLTHTRVYGAWVPK